MDGVMIYKPSWVSSKARPIKCDFDSELPEVRAILAISTCKKFKDEPVLEEMDLMAKYQREDPILSQLITSVRKKSKPVFLDLKNPEQASLNHWFKRFELHPTNELLLVRYEDNLRVLVPTKVRPALVFNMHNKHMHIGAPRVMSLLHNYTWPSIASDVTNFVQSCDLCRRRKGVATNQTPPLLHLARPSAPWQVCYMDFVSFPDSSSGYKYALTYMCGFSRYLITVPLRNERAEDCARALVSHVFLPYSPPAVISCDRGAAFTSKLMAETCKIWGIDLTFTVLGDLSPRACSNACIGS